MTFGNLWPLALLVCVPAIILLYLLKQKAKEEDFSSIFLWKEIYQNLEATTPWEKLKQNILMYLQILCAVLIIIGLMAPLLRNGGSGAANVIMVLDNSASMQYHYEGGRSRLDEQLVRAGDFADRLNEGSRVILLLSGADTDIIYNGSDKSELKRAISRIEPANVAGNLDNATDMAASLAQNMESCRIVLFTDTAFETAPLVQSVGEEAVTVVDLYSEGDNLSLDYISYAAEESLTVLAKLSNYADREVSSDVNLYADDVLLDIVSVTLPAGGSEVVYFEDLELPQPGDGDQPVILKAEIQEKDDLPADNNARTAMTEASEHKVLLFSQGNLFLEKALTVDDTVDLYKADDTSVLLSATEEYDLYIFDGMLPESFDEVPKDSALLIFNQTDNENSGGYFQSEGLQTQVMLTLAENAATGYAGGFSFGVNSAAVYALPEWGRILLTGNDSQCIGYYGVKDSRRVAVLGFDIHETDLALQAEFPLFIMALTAELFGSGTGAVSLDNFPAAEESQVVPVSAMEGGAQFTGRLSGGREIRSWFILAAVLFLIVEWFVYARQVRSSRKRQYLIIRGVIFLCLLLALAGIRLNLVSQRAATIFLVDLSDSMAANREAIEEYLKDAVAGMPKGNSFGIVTFGKTATIDSVLTDQRSFSQLSTAPQATATNIEKAILVGLSMFDEDTAKRLVLITDGSQNEGDMSLVAAELVRNNIDLGIIRLEDGIMQAAEVYVSGLRTPDIIHVDDVFNVTVTVTSNIRTEALISLYAGRELKDQKTVSLNTGENQFVFQDVGKEGNIQSYRAVVEAPGDSLTENNQYVSFTQVEAKPRLLVIEGEADKGAEFAAILDSIGMEYDIMPPSGAPGTIMELNQYKCVITLDVYYDDLRQSFVNNLATYIKDFAGGFICIGGSNSYALGNYDNTVLEEVLPVQMELQGEKEIPKTAVIMVIDQSGSMSSPSEENSSITGLDLAKRAAVEALGSLRGTDIVGVLAFDDQYNWIVEPRQADDIEAIKSAVETIGYGGGTSIYPALAQAALAIDEQDAVLKHIILLTDGQDSFRQYDELYSEINAAGITVSTVAAGSGSDQLLLNEIAETCGGRYYYTDINSNIPRIFAQEVYLSAKSYLINETFVPVITSNSIILQGVFEEGSPELHGYVAASAKTTANVLLESPKTDPLLSVWQYGLGRTVAWNSDGTNEWTGNFARWENYPLLWQNIIQYTISDTDLGEDYVMVEQADSGTVIRYYTDEYDAATAVTGVMTDADGQSQEIELTAVAPGEFETVLPTDEVGIYGINIRKQQDGSTVKNANTAVARQYSEEYRFRENDGALAGFAGQTGAAMLTFSDNIWQERLENVSARISLTVPLLIAALALLIFDIMIRRLGLDIWGQGSAGLTRAGSWIAAHTGRRGRHPEDAAVRNTPMPMPAEPPERESVMSVREPVKYAVAESAGAEAEASRNSSRGTSEKSEKKYKNKKGSEPDLLDMGQLLKRKQDRDDQ